MRWDRFFEDLEDQLDSEWEAERAALDTEAERLRLSRVALRDRLTALLPDPRELSVDLLDGSTVRGAVTRVGADWFGLAGEGRMPSATLVPLGSVAAIAPGVEGILGSVRDASAGCALSQRMGFGFVLRDLVRRRIPVVVCVAPGRTLAGTIDRAGADHLDLALHEPGTPRRTENVTGYRMLPFSGVLAVRLDAGIDLV